VLRTQPRSLVWRSQAQRPNRYGLQFNPGQFGSGPLLVEGVVEGMAAEASGLRAGNRILALDGTSVSDLSMLDLATMFRRSPLTVSVERDGETIEMTMTLD